MDIIFGAMVDPIHVQVGYKFKNYQHFQKDMDVITRLLIRGLINDSQAHSARKKFVKKLEKTLGGEND